MAGDDAAARWRLVLGRHADEPLGEPQGGGPGENGGRDQVLSYLYDREHAERSHRAGTGSSGILSTLSWLNGARSLFPREAVEVMERDALVRYGLTELVTDPELLKRIEPSIELVGAILAFRDRMRPPVLVEARRIVREVVEKLARQLRKECEPALYGVAAPSRDRPLRILRNTDWTRTIRRNLRRWDPDQRRLTVDRLSFRNRQRTRPAWRIVIAVDQSGSMMEALIHGAVTAAVLATAPSVTVHLVLWDHRVVDLSGKVDDPLDVLLSTQLGGGTLLYPALRYCADLITVPARTIVAVVSDFQLNDPPAPTLALAQELVAEGVKCFGFCALSADGTGVYDPGFAKRLAGAGWWVGAVTPRALVETVGRLLR